MTQTPPQAPEPAVLTPSVELAPVVQGAPVVKQTERPHPLTPFIRGWLVFVAIVFTFGRQLLPDRQSEEGFDTADLRWVVLAVAATVGIAALAGLVSWYYTRFVIDADELRVETGAVFKSS